jgi:hypothetical protein
MMVSKRGMDATSPEFCSGYGSADAFDLESVQNNRNVPNSGQNARLTAGTHLGSLRQ